jgi:DNA topoisomerase II
MTTDDSQTKENITLQAKISGSKFSPTEAFITAVDKSGINESVMACAKSKAQNELNKQCHGKKHAKLMGIPELEDVDDAGTRNSIYCTLILIIMIIIMHLYGAFYIKWSKAL